MSAVFVQRRMQPKRCLLPRSSFQFHTILANPNCGMIRPPAAALLLCFPLKAFTASSRRNTKVTIMLLDLDVHRPLATHNYIPAETSGRSDEVQYQLPHHMQTPTDCQSRRINTSPYWGCPATKLFGHRSPRSTTCMPLLLCCPSRYQIYVMQRAFSQPSQVR